MRAVKIAELRRDNEACDVVRARNANLAAGTQIAAERLALERKNGLLDILGLQPDGFAAFRQRIASLTAVEQPRPELAFEVVDPASDRRSTALEHARRTALAGLSAFLACPDRWYAAIEKRPPFQEHVGSIPIT